MLAGAPVRDARGLRWLDRANDPSGLRAVTEREAGQDSVVALDLPVVPLCVRATPFQVNQRGEVLRGILARSRAARAEYRRGRGRDAVRPR